VRKNESKIFEIIILFKKNTHIQIEQIKKGCFVDNQAQSTLNGLYLMTATFDHSGDCAKYCKTQSYLEGKTKSKR